MGQPVHTFIVGHCGGTASHRTRGGRLAINTPPDVKSRIDAGIIEDRIRQQTTGTKIRQTRPATLWDAHFLADADGHIGFSNRPQNRL
jgi:hypothetical protein